MRKKILSLVFLLALMLSFSAVKVFADDVIMGETLVYTYTYIDDLPSEFVKGSDIAMYEYEGKTIYDFRAYFEVYNNAETILNVHKIDGAIDLGGYVWETDFDIDVLGVYEVSLSYDGITGLKSETINLEVIEEDIEAPSIFMESGNFNKTRAENPNDFLNEFNAFIRKARIYDKVDGVINITMDDFLLDDIEKLKEADLREQVKITLNVTDKAGNEASKSATLTIVDVKAPNIHNVRTVTTKKGQRINYTNHLGFSDNYSDLDNIQRRYSIFSTLVVKNIWKSGSRRAKPSEGNELKNYLRLKEEGLSSFVDYLDVTYPTVYVVGDYYEVITEETVNYIVITSKVNPVDGGQPQNKWEQTTDKKVATGRRLERLEVSTLSEAELLEYVNENHEEGFRTNDYYQTLDLTTGNRFFVYIELTENILRDQQQTIDFTKPGVQYVRVEAEDEFGNIASASYRVVITDGLSVLEAILIVNGVVLVIAGLGIAAYIVFKRRQ